MSPCGRRCHVSKVVIEEEEKEVVLPEGGTNKRVFDAVFSFCVKAFLPVCARLTGECRVLARGSTVG